MNDQSTIDTSAALALPDATELPSLFTNDKIGEILDRIKSDALAIAPDVSTAKGRKDIASLAHKVARSKTALDNAGKQLTEQARKQIEAVNAQRRQVRDDLDALKAQVRKPLEDWETAEEARKEAHRNRLSLFALDRTDWQMASAEIEKIIDEVEAIEVGSEWEEFETMAEDAKGEALSKFRSDLRAAKAREEQAAELERLRKEKEEREAREREEAERRQKEEAEARAKEEARQAQKDHVEQMMERIAECREGRIGGEPQSYDIVIYELETKIAAEITSEKVGEDHKALDALRVAAIEHLKQLQAFEQRERERKAEEERQEAEEKARAEAAEQQRREQAAKEEEERKAREKREKNARHRAKIKREIRASIDGMDLDQVADALMDGKVAHVTVEI